jgi:1,4-dihydroxy-2-naphthoyl-CoA synthase
MMSEYETILYQNPVPGVARVVMNRPEMRTAQNLQTPFKGLQGTTVPWRGKAP